MKAQLLNEFVAIATKVAQYCDDEEQEAKPLNSPEFMEEVKNIELFSEQLFTLRRKYAVMLSALGEFLRMELEEAEKKEKE